MHWGWAILGTAIIIFVGIDLIWTTLTMQGAGPLTERITRPLGTFLAGRPPRGWLTFARLNAAVIAILVTLVVWMGLMWTGWILVFCGADEAVLDAQDGRPAGLFDRIYFAGFAVITLGVGDYRPGGPLWQVLTVVSSMTGFALVTLSITYLLPIVSAAVQKRALALTIRHLGETPEQFVENGWDGHSFDGLEQHLVSLASLLLEDSQRSLSYPVLEYYRTTEPRSSLAYHLSVLSEALHLLRHGVAEQVRPRWVTLHPLRRAIEEILSNSRLPEDALERDPPPPKSLEPLRAAGIPTRSDADYERALSNDIEHRNQVRALVRWHGWDLL